jgi:tetratricopeptide (TPR) repeat protein
MSSGQSHYQIGTVGLGATVLQGEHLSVGLTGAEVQELTKAAAAGAVGPLADKIVDLSQKLGVTQGAALAILHALGHENIPADRLPDMLASAATQIIAMRQSLSRPRNDASETSHLRQAAVSALDAGAFDEAARILNTIRALEREASERRRQAAEESRADWLSGLEAEAETCALLGRAALAQRDVGAARAHFEEGFQLLAPLDQEARWSYANKAAKALLLTVDDAAALSAAIDLYHLALGNVAREHEPLKWARTTFGLGIALHLLGEKEGKVERLQGAVATFRIVLEEWTRDRVPPNWANTQIFLGDTLQLLGRLQTDTELLERAIAAYRCALEEISVDRDHNTWIETEARLANLLQIVGERETGTKRLEEAVNAWQECLRAAETVLQSHEIVYFRMCLHKTQIEIERRSVHESAGQNSKRSLFEWFFGCRAKGSTLWRPKDMVLVRKLQEVLAESRGRPIDSAYAPARLYELKRTLRRRLDLPDDLPDAPSKRETTTLYLELSWFVDNWDELDCAKIFLRRPNDSGPAQLKRLITCLTMDSGLALVAKNRTQLAQELATVGVRIGDELSVKGKG